MNIYYYCIADFNFVLTLPHDWSADALLPSFRIFGRKVSQGGELFRMSVHEIDNIPEIPENEWLESSSSDLGYMHLCRDGEGYKVTLSSDGRSPQALLQMNGDYSEAVAYIQTGIPDAGNILSSMIRIVYSQAIIPFGGFSVHASSVAKDGYSCLFLGKSGTGKSTHSRLWTELFPDCELLNDDNPVIRVKDCGVIAYGTPWSGKTPCYKNKSFPVKGIVRLVQAPDNVYSALADADAFIALLPSCSVMSCNSLLRSKLYDLLVSVCGMIRIGCLECRAEEEAARICHENILEK